MQENKIQEIYTNVFQKFTFRGTLAILIIVSCFGFLFTVLKIKIPTQNKDIVYLATGLLLGLSSQVVSWYFGSSKDKADADKVEHAKNLSGKQVTTTTTQTPDGS